MPRFHSPLSFHSCAKAHHLPNDTENQKVLESVNVDHAGQLLMWRAKMVWKRKMNVSTRMSVQVIQSVSWPLLLTARVLPSTSPPFLPVLFSGDELPDGPQCLATANRLQRTFLSLYELDDFLGLQIQEQN